MICRFWPGGCCKSSLWDIRKGNKICIGLTPTVLETLTVKASMWVTTNEQWKQLNRREMINCCSKMENWGVKTRRSFISKTSWAPTELFLNQSIIWLISFKIIKKQIFSNIWESFVCFLLLFLKRFRIILDDLITCCFCQFSYCTWLGWKIAYFTSSASRTQISESYGKIFVFQITYPITWTH